MDAPQTHEAKDALIEDDNVISIEDMTHRSFAQSVGILHIICRV